MPTFGRRGKEEESREKLHNQGRKKNSNGAKRKANLSDVAGEK